jgi:two-component sensor histidine kinase
MTMPPVRAGLTAEDAGVIRGVATREGVPVVLAFAQAPFSGYGALLTMPVAAFEAPARAALLRALGAGAALVLAGLGLALFLARRILGAFHHVAAAAARPEAASPTTGLPEADALITTLAQAGRERRQAEQQRALLMRELDHRAKNVMAVALSLVRLTPREDAARFAAAVEGRIAAMARAHSLLAGGRWGGASRRSLAEGELHGMLGRVRLTGPAVRLAADAVQPVAMLLHELATNAAKHGALSLPEGRVALGWEFTAPEEGLRLSWRESGGPAVAEPPARRGFGSRLLVSLAERQLGGLLEFDWRPEGLAVTLTLPARHVVQDAAGRQPPAASPPRLGEAA